MRPFDLSKVRDPNALGETFRSHAFAAHADGLDQDFRLRAGFEAVADARELRDLRAICGTDYLGDLRAFREAATGLTVAWHWEGRGTLLFLYDGVGVVARDCGVRDAWEFLGGARGR